MFEKRKEPTQKIQEPPPVEEKPTPTMPTRTHAASVIGPSIKINGDIFGEENLVIEGHVDGYVQVPSHDLTIGSAGNVPANLSAKSVRIDGTVNGNIEAADLVTVSASGRVEGDIKAPRVNLEDGAKFRGSIDMDPGSSPVSAASHSFDAEPSDEVEPQRSTG